MRTIPINSNKIPCQTLKIKKYLEKSSNNEGYWQVTKKHSLKKSKKQYNIIYLQKNNQDKVIGLIKKDEINILEYGCGTSQ